MRIAIIGRTKTLVNTARLLLAHGHEIPIVWTCRAEEFYGANTDDFRSLASEIGADFRDDLTINGPEGRQHLARLGCDVAVSINWLTLIKDEVLALFPMGVLNAHAGDLPRYRGNACPNWAILANEPYIGLCVHRMVEKLDAGPILVKRRLAVTESTYIGDVYAWINIEVPTMFLEAIDTLHTEGFKSYLEEGSAGLRCYPRRPEDARINWQHPAAHIHRLVRASSRPFSGAFTSLEGNHKVTIWRADILRHDGPFFAVPGQVCYSIGDDPVIATGEELIRLTELTIDGAVGSETAKKEIMRSLRNRLI